MIRVRIYVLLLACLVATTLCSNLPSGSTIVDATVRSSQGHHIEPVNTAHGSDHSSHSSTKEGTTDGDEDDNGDDDDDNDNDKIESASRILKTSVRGCVHHRRHHMCPIGPEDEEGCRVSPPNPRPGQVSGLGAFRYDENSENRPSNWANLNCKTGEFAAYRTCSYCNNTCGGRFQSPIDVRTNNLRMRPRRLAPKIRLSHKAFIEYKMAADNFELECVKENSCGFTIFQGKRWNFKQVHMHHFSEHYLNGRSFPLEMHFVHASDDGGLLVLALFFKHGSFNPLLQQYLNIGAARCRGKFKLHAITKHALKAKKSVYYVGSTTTPPCSENRNWIVSTKPLTASDKQIRQFLRLMGNIDDNRPLQPLNGRHITGYW